MELHEEYRLKRLLKRIRLREISKHLNCTLGLLSNWENNRTSMSQEKVELYMQYIDSK